VGAPKLRVILQSFADSVCRLDANSIAGQGEHVHVLLIANTISHVLGVILVVQLQSLTIERQFVLSVNRRQGSEVGQLKEVFV